MTFMNICTWEKVKDKNYITERILLFFFFLGGKLYKYVFMNTFRTIRRIMFQFLAV